MIETPHSPRRWRNAGFTLIEVMLVVTIMGILSGIAVPSFVELIRQSHVRGAADGLAAFLQETTVEVKKTRRNTSVLFVPDGAVRYQSANCTGTVTGRFRFDDDVMSINPSGPDLGSLGLDPRFLVDNGGALYGSARATVGDDWTIEGKQCALFRADRPGTFGNTLGQGGVYVRYRNDAEYGAWVLKTTDNNRFRAYTKEHGVWYQR
ncbi:MAG: prepilin-type N-terminal cleavage/methylation domain-containing protein [Fibrobacterales bacterium]|nr:prepilin-type N-terminal cleavage/methylation domain-containing protein [Fibrobacterales bacterium]